MLSLSLVDSRIFFVSEMKFPYKRYFTHRKNAVKSFTTFLSVK